MYEELHGKGLEIVGISKLYGYYGQERPLTPEAETAKMPGFIAEHGLPWQVILGDNDNFARYGVGGIPQYVVIGRNGKVASITIGYNEELHNQLRKSVEAELAKPATDAK